MEQLSFLEKLAILGQNILEHPVFICLLLLPVVLIFFNKKITKKAVVLIYIAVLAIVLFVGNTTIFALFDNVVDGIFMALYFPNFVTLFIVEVLSAVITLISFLKRGISKTNKIINITAFAIIQTLFCLILTVVQVNDINIYEENALYASNDVLTLMQLLMGAFALQIITLVVLYAIDKITEKLDSNELDYISKQVEELSKTKLTEGRITHAKVEPEIKVVTLEPEVNLPEMKPVEPLNKDFIRSIHIEPVDVKEEIIREEKERNKPDLLKPMEMEEQLEGISNDEVIEEFIDSTEEKVEVKEVLDRSKEDELKETYGRLEKPDLLKPMEFAFDKVKEEGSLSVSDGVTNIQDFKPESEVSIDKVPKVKEDIQLEETVIPLVPIVKTTEGKPLEKGCALVEENSKEKSDELITNLVIVNFGKTVSAIRNLKTVYTL